MLLEPFSPFFFEGALPILTDCGEKWAAEIWRAQEGQPVAEVVPCLSQSSVALSAADPGLL